MGMNKLCGIYKISTPEGGSYIGQSSDIEARWYHHRRALENGTHYNPLLKAAFVTYGEFLEYSIIAYCERTELMKLEHLAIRALKPSFNMTNLNHKKVRALNGSLAHRVNISRGIKAGHARRKALGL
jgi:group I intron endonuclease